MTKKKKELNDKQLSRTWHLETKKTKKTETLTRDQLQADMETFLKEGGHVKEIPPGVHTVQAEEEKVTKGWIVSNYSTSLTDPKGGFPFLPRQPYE